MHYELSLKELKQKIDWIRKFSHEQNIDLSEEINDLENRFQVIQEELYKNLTAIDKLQLARHQSRPSTLDYIKIIFDKFIELHGDRLYGDDYAIIGGIARINGMSVTVIGHQKGKNTKEHIKRNFGMAHPEGYRKALRLMKQAEKFKRPVITFIDTPGAYPGIAAEERGQSEAIAKNLLEMSKLKVPIMCIVIGEGGSGGALALGVGDKLLMLEHAIYAVASPNAAASILFKDATKVDQVTESLKITAQNLMEFGIIDEIIPEPKGGAHNDLNLQANYIKKSILQNFEKLINKSEHNLVNERFEKMLKIGRFITLESEDNNKY